MKIFNKNYITSLFNKRNVKNIKVAVGMSGGVDSSVTAALLKKQGYDVTGIFLKFWSDPTHESNGKVSNKCCSVESMYDARRVANKLGIELITLNMSVRFKDFIVDNFLEEYENGSTPNPCVRCNRFVKTQYFLKKARELGFDKIATGHYVITKKEKDGNYSLNIPKDKNKDQTYFMYKISQDTVANTMFPLGQYEKSEVRELAKKFNLPTHSKQDSQEVCFVADQGHNNFIKKWLTPKIGEIVDTNGSILGNHDGLPLYTFGQRKGLDVGGPEGPYFVVDKDFKNNRLVVSNDPNYPGLFKKEIIIYDTNWINEEPNENTKYNVKTRYRQELQLAQIKKIGNEYKIIFENPQRAVTPGQSAVVYENDRMLGGGVIK